MPASHAEIESTTSEASDAAVVAAAMAANTPRAFPVMTVGRMPEGGLARAFDGLTDDELDSFLDKALFSFQAKVDTALFDARQEMRSVRPGSGLRAEIPQALSGEWWIEVNDKPVGPVSFAFIEQQYDDGVIGPDNFCWRKGYRDWVALSRVPEAVAALSPVMLDAEEIEEIEEARYQSQSLKQISFARLDAEPATVTAGADFLAEDEATEPSAVALLPELHAAELAPEPPTPSMELPPMQTYAPTPPVLYPAPSEGLLARLAHGVKSIARVVFT